MSLDLATILPNITHSLEGTGFLFGAGTSVEAGYPMMSCLTRKVIGALSTAERTVLDEVLKAVGIAYNDTVATPNIEEIADLVIAHAINSKDARCFALETKFRELVVQAGKRAKGVTSRHSSIRLTLSSILGSIGL